MKSIIECLKEINREYEKCPDGWKHFYGADGQERPTVYVYHYENFWMIKFDSLFGFSGAGIRGRLEDDEDYSTHLSGIDFGLRI